MATFPVRKEGGSVASVIVAALDLNWIGELATNAVPGSGAEVLVIDGGGTVVAASADAEGLVGKNFTGHGLTKELLAKDEGTTTMIDFDGTKRIFGFVRVPYTKARLAFGVSESTVHSGIDREITIAYVQLGVFGMLVLFIKPRQQQRKLFTAIAGYGQLLLKGDVRQGLADRAQTGVALHMAVAIVEQLEVVDIDHHQGKRLAQFVGASWRTWMRLAALSPSASASSRGCRSRASLQLA
jgi:hypothetical protein